VKVSDPRGRKHDVLRVRQQQVGVKKNLCMNGEYRSDRGERGGGGEKRGKVANGKGVRMGRLVIKFSLDKTL